jgi:GH15 family glucan-1,4-alpha-glucosidase
MPDTATLGPATQSAESLFPPIADYGFLPNCEQSGLVAPDGSVEWMCLPRPDSPSVFGALLDRAAGFSGAEGTFTICSFWLVTALHMIGETDRARALCHKLLSFAGPLQLYAEEIDAATGQHLGNFPQAFTHLALIEAVTLLIKADQEGTPAATA